MIHCVQKTSPFFHCGLYKRWPISIGLIYHTVYRVNLQHNNYWFTRLTYVLLLHYIGKINLMLTSSTGTRAVRVRRSSYSLLQRETSKFIPPDLWPHNSPDLNPVQCQIWDMMQDRVYQMPVQDVADLQQRLIDARCKSLSTMLSMNGVREFRVKKEVSWTLAVIFRLKCRPTVCINWNFFYYFVQR